jgi:hypothetical protein
MPLHGKTMRVLLSARQEIIQDELEKKYDTKPKDAGTG